MRGAADAVDESLLYDDSSSHEIQILRKLSTRLILVSTATVNLSSPPKGELEGHEY
jgi:hypothetical protein